MSEGLGADYDGGNDDTQNEKKVTRMVLLDSFKELTEEEKAE